MTGDREKRQEAECRDLLGFEEEGVGQLSRLEQRAGRRLAETVVQVIAPVIGWQETAGQVADEQVIGEQVIGEQVTGQ